MLYFVDRQDATNGEGYHPVPEALKIAEDDQGKESAGIPAQSGSFVLDGNVNEFFEPSRVIAKIADFGLASRSTLPESRRLVANPLWLAPEILKGESYSTEADVYGYGIVLWELFARSIPFRDSGIRFMSALEEQVRVALHSLAGPWKGAESRTDY